LHDIEDVAHVIVAIAKFLCKFDEAIDVLTDICAPEVAPLVDAGLDASCAVAETATLFNCAKTALSTIQEGKECV
jgi:hypothetical protein